jgi:hypothetical protein
MKMEIYLSERVLKSQQNQAELLTVHTKKENNGRIAICVKNCPKW